MNAVQSEEVDELAEVVRGLTDKITTLIDEIRTLHATPSVYSIDDVAVVLGLLTRAGKPNRRAVHEIIRAGKLRIVDPGVPIGRWTVSRAELERYTGRRCDRDRRDPNPESHRWW